MSHLHPVQYSFREYVRVEDERNVRHELVGGQIYAMAGGPPEHSALIASASAHLSNVVRGGPCRVHTSDLRVCVLETGLVTYPDVTVVRGPWERHPDDRSTVTNPTVLVEVTSPSTAAYDRGEKLEHFKRIPTLQVCMLVAHDRREVEVWMRVADGWSRTLAGPGSVIDLRVLDARLDVDAVYADAAEPT